MFGRKQEKIKILQGDLARAIERRDTYYGYWQETTKAFARTDSELKILQEAFRQGVEITEELKARNQELENELGDLKTLTQNIREEAADSSRMLELYRALFSQLRIVVKLPAKKKNG